MNPSPSKSNPTVRAPADGPASGTIVWIAVVVVVVLIGGIAIFLARGGDDKPPIEDETSAVTVTTPASGGPAGVPTLVPGGLPQVGEDGSDPAIGMVIPTVTGVTVDDEPITIGPDGRPKVLVFMAHWCPHCRDEIPRLVEHLADGGPPDDVDIVGISTRVERDQANYPPSRWLEDEGWTVPTLKDSQESTAYAAFGAGGFPYFVAVDAEGHVVVRISGELPMDVFDRLVDAARTGER